MHCYHWLSYWFSLSKGLPFWFNGQEKDDEVSGVGNTMTTEFWEYDGSLKSKCNLNPKIYVWLICIFKHMLYFGLF
jgi:hypothetical protein